MSKLFTSIICLALSGCNALFYHPDRDVYLTPSYLGLKYESRSLLAQDGAPLSLWHIHATTPPVGTVLHFHGNGQNMTAHFYYVVWLAEHGFDVITYDYRGYGSSGGEPERHKITEDSRQVLKYANDHAADGNLFVIAQSLGGAVAIAAAAKQNLPQLRALVLEGTFGSYRQMARDRLAANFITWPLQWPLSFLVSNELSPVDYIGSISVPTLFIHSEHDPIVPASMSTELIAKAKMPRKEIWIIDSKMHLSAFVTADDRYRTQLLEFLCSTRRSMTSDCNAPGKSAAR